MMLYKKIFAQGVAVLLSFQSQTKPIIAIVDPTSSGLDFPSKIIERGIECVAFESDSCYQGSGQKMEKGCCSDIIYFESYTNTLESLKKINPCLVFSGNESGTLFADKLSEDLKLPFHSSRLSIARRDKYEMHKIAAEHNLRIPIQNEVDNVDDALYFMETKNLQYPVVIKPRMSTGSQGVSIVYNATDLETSINTIIHNKNIFGQSNGKAIIQEFIDGEEYFINTVSSQGNHYTTDIFLYKKGKYNKSEVVYENAELLTSNGVIQNKLKDFSYRILNALEINNGAAHIEVKINSEGETVFIEAGARVAGAFIHRITQKCMSNKKNQLDYTLDSYLNPEKLLDLQAGYTLSQHGKIVFLISEKQGFVSSLEKDSAYKAISSLVDIRFKLNVGDILHPTIDLITCPGVFYLVGDKKQIIDDENKIRKNKECFCTLKN